MLTGRASLDCYRSYNFNWVELPTCGATGSSGKWYTNLPVRLRIQVRSERPKITALN